MQRRAAVACIRLMKEGRRKKQRWGGLREERKRQQERTQHVARAAHCMAAARTSAHGTPGRRPVAGAVAGRLGQCSSAHTIWRCPSCACAAHSSRFKLASRFSGFSCAFEHNGQRPQRPTPRPASIAHIASLRRASHLPHVFPTHQASRHFYFLLFTHLHKPPRVNLLGRPWEGVYSRRWEGCTRDRR